MDIIQEFANVCPVDLVYVEPTAAVFGPGAAVNESNHLALRN